MGGSNGKRQNQRRMHAPPLPQHLPLARLFILYDRTASVLWTAGHHLLVRTLLQTKRKLEARPTTPKRPLLPSSSRVGLQQRRVSRLHRHGHYLLPPSYHFCQAYGAPVARTPPRLLPHGCRPLRQHGVDRQNRAVHGVSEPYRGYNGRLGALHHHVDVRGNLRRYNSG